MLNNREVATLILIAVGIILILAMPNVRRPVLAGVADTVRAASHLAILRVFATYLAWCAAWIWLAWRVGLWNLDLLKDSIIIVVTVGFPVLFAVMKVRSGGGILRTIVKETVALSALLAFYVNLEPFSIPAEVGVQLILFVLVLLTAAASVPNGKPIASCASILLVLAGLALVVWTTTQLVLTAGQRDWEATAMELALSVWLPLSMFGFFYGLAFVGYVEQAATRMRRLYNPPARKRVMIAVVLGLRFRLRRAAAFNGRYQGRVGQAATFREGLSAMRNFRQEVLDLEAREQEGVTRLAVMAGEPGTDGDGAQLDRREFDGTKRAFRDILHTAQELRYEQLGNRYWDDLTDMVIHPVSYWGLPEEHGIRVEVTADHQKWRAWRRLPSSWVLGIGGKDGERREYLYSGPEQPTSWPGDPDWFDTAVTLNLSADWERSDSPIR